MEYSEEKELRRSSLERNFKQGSRYRCCRLLVDIFLYFFCSSIKNCFISLILSCTCVYICSLCLYSLDLSIQASQFGWRWASTFRSQQEPSAGIFILPAHTCSLISILYPISSRSTASRVAKHCAFKLWRLRVRSAWIRIMEYPWNSGALPPPAEGELNLLGGDNILLDLDEKTLQVRVIFLVVIT